MYPWLWNLRTWRIDCVCKTNKAEEKRRSGRKLEEGPGKAEVTKNRNLKRVKDSPSGKVGEASRDAVLRIHLINQADSTPALLN